MKPQELRINNWVKLDGELETIVDCHDITQLDVAPHSIIIEPIPLTEEWLLKFGFEKFDDELNYSLSCGRKTLQVGMDDGYGNLIFLFQEDVGCGFNDLANESEHVHQLQNLYFALTGEELTIKE